MAPHPTPRDSSDLIPAHSVDNVETQLYELDTQMVEAVLDRIDPTFSSSPPQAFAGKLDSWRLPPNLLGQGQLLLLHPRDPQLCRRLHLSSLSGAGRLVTRAMRRRTWQMSRMMATAGRMSAFSLRSPRTRRRSPAALAEKGQTPLRL